MNPLEIHKYVSESSGREVGDISPLTAELTALASKAQAEAPQALLPDAVASAQRDISEDLVREVQEAFEQRERAMEIAQRHLDDLIEYLQGYNVPQDKLRPLMDTEVFYDEDNEQAYIAQTDGTPIPRLDLSMLGLTGELPLPQELKLNALNCAQNQLTGFSELPTSLLVLVCRYNQLTSLPELPVSLINLYCNSNQLTSLPELPSGLTDLDCSDNQFTEQQKEAILEQFPGVQV